MKANQSIKDLLSREFLHDKERRALTALLAGELAAVDTYKLAISKVKDRELIPILENCRVSHAERIEMLRERMEKLGDAAPNSAGWWGSFASFVEGGATIISDRVAMSVLAAGEEIGFEQCEERMKDLDSGSYEMVEEELIPEQKKTLETMTILCAWLKSEDHEFLQEQKRATIQSTKNNSKLEGANQPLSSDKKAAVHRQHPGLRKEFYNPFWFGE